MRHVIETTDDYIIWVDENGVKKKTILASDAQMQYLNSLRRQLGKEPLKGKPPLFKAKKAIETAKRKLENLKKKESEPNQESLF